MLLCVVAQSLKPRGQTFSYVKKGATTPNIVGPTMLANVGSCCLRLYVALYNTVLLADVKRIVVVIADGFSTRGFEYTKELTDQLKQSRIQFFSVGTSKRVNKPELDEISSQPVDTHELIVDLKNRSFTEAQVERLAKDICK